MDNPRKDRPRVAPDPNEISKAIALLFKPGDVIELRVPKAGRRGTLSGYFADVEKLAKTVHKLSQDCTLPGIYWTINPCDKGCFSRHPDDFKSYATTTTSDGEIAARRWLAIDCDPIRVAGVSSTDEEKAAAKKLAIEILRYLQKKGFTGLVFADSGNG